MEITATLLDYFWVIIYINGEFKFFENFRVLVFKKTKLLLTQFWVIMYITGEFHLYEKHRNFNGLVLGNN